MSRLLARIVFEIDRMFQLLALIVLWGLRVASAAHEEHFAIRRMFQLLALPVFVICRMSQVPAWPMFPSVACEPNVIPNFVESRMNRA